MKFRKNKIRYGQDFSQHEGIPAGVDFRVERVKKGVYKLTGRGYGDPKKYGNGAIYPWGLTAKQERRFKQALAAETML